MYLNQETEKVSPEICKAAVGMVEGDAINPLAVARLLEQAIEDATRVVGNVDMTLPEFAPARLLVRQLMKLTGIEPGPQQREIMEKDIRWCRAQEL